MAWRDRNKTAPTGKTKADVKLVRRGIKSDTCHDKNLDLQPVKELKSQDACLWQPSSANSMQPPCCVRFVPVLGEPTKKDFAKIDVSPYGERVDDIGLEPTTSTMSTWSPGSKTSVFIGFLIPCFPYITWFCTRKGSGKGSEIVSSICGIYVLENDFSFVFSCRQRGQVRGAEKLSWALQDQSFYPSKTTDRLIDSVV